MVSCHDFGLSIASYLGKKDLYPTLPRTFIINHASEKLISEACFIIYFLSARK